MFSADKIRVKDTGLSLKTVHLKISTVRLDFTKKFVDFQKQSPYIFAVFSSLFIYNIVLLQMVPNIWTISKKNFI